MVGLGAVSGCRLQGAERIICVDLSPRAARARAGHGANRRDARGPDVVEQLLELTGGLGADYTFEATGNVNVMRQAVESARMGWPRDECVVAGKGETLDVVPRFLITDGASQVSSFGRSQRTRFRFRSFVDMYLAGDNRRRRLRIAQAHA